MPRAILALIATALLSAPAMAQTKVVFGTDWLAEAEHGGFYQALALGFYKKHGLDVTIRMGGPQVNPPQQVAAGVVDFQLSSGSFAAMSMAQQGIPVLAVAAFFQKDPEVLIAHPNTGADTIGQMKGKPIMMSAANRTGTWLFLQAKFGFSDSQIRPYNFSVAPFLADPNAIEMGFVSSSRIRSKRPAGSSRWSTCSPITAMTGIPPSSSPRAAWCSSIPRWCAPSSRPRSRGGAAIWTTPPRVTR